MEDYVSIFDNERANICMLHLKALTQEVQQLESCVGNIVPPSGIKQKCTDIYMTRAMIISSARQLERYKCADWAINAYDSWYEYWSDHREGRYD